jgi:hypothetical protein
MTGWGLCRSVNSFGHWHKAMRLHLFRLTDAQWVIIEHRLPTDGPGDERVDDRRVISDILHVLRDDFLRSAAPGRQVNRTVSGRSCLPGPLPRLSITGTIFPAVDTRFPGIREEVAHSVAVTVKYQGHQRDSQRDREHDTQHGSESGGRVEPEPTKPCQSPGKGEQNHDGGRGGDREPRRPWQLPPQRQRVHLKVHIFVASS